MLVMQVFSNIGLFCMLEKKSRDLISFFNINFVRLPECKFDFNDVVKVYLENAIGVITNS